MHSEDLENLINNVKKDFIIELEKFLEMEGPRNLWYGCIVNPYGVTMCNELMFVNIARSVMSADPENYTDPARLYQLRWDYEAPGLFVADFLDEPFASNEKLQSLIKSHINLSYEEQVSSPLASIMYAIACSIEEIREIIALDLYLTRDFSLVLSINGKDLEKPPPWSGQSYNPPELINKTQYGNTSKRHARVLTLEEKNEIQKKTEKAMKLLCPHEEAMVNQKILSEKILEEIKGKWINYKERRELLRKFK
jgi:hypothetical protein